MWNQILVTAFLSSVSVMLGAALQHYFGRTLESRKQLTLQRSQSYVDYFKAFASIAQYAGSKEILAAATDAKIRICIYGSPAVVKRLRDFELAGAALNSAESETLITLLLKEMRKDTGVNDSEISRDDFLPILFHSTSK